MSEEKKAKEETPVKGIVLPVGTVGTFCVVAAVLCADFIEQAIRYMQEEAAVLTIISKMLAAAGWGLVTIYVAAKLWRNYQHTKKQK